MPIHITSELILKLFFLCILFYITWTDLKYRIIPNRCVIAAIFIRFLYFMITGEGDWRAFFWLVFNGFIVSIPVFLLTFILETLLKKAVLGGGDIKLLFVLGLYLGLEKCLLMLLIACILSIIGTVITMIKSKDGTAETFPFGPYLATGSAVALLFGDVIMTAYLSLLK